MVSGALGKIFRLCPTFFVMQIRVILLSPPSLVPQSLGARGSCPSRLPLDPPLSGGKLFHILHDINHACSLARFSLPCDKPTS